jgi:hypothetical protein
VGGQPNSPLSPREHVLCHARTYVGTGQMKLSPKRSGIYKKSEMAGPGRPPGHPYNLGKDIAQIMQVVGFSDAHPASKRNRTKGLGDSHDDGTLPHVGFSAIGQLCGNGDSDTMASAIEELRIACSRVGFLKLFGTRLCGHGAQLHALIGPLGNVVEVELLHADYFRLFPSRQE